MDKKMGGKMMSIPFKLIELDKQLRIKTLDAIPDDEHKIATFNFDWWHSELTFTLRKADEGENRLHLYEQTRTSGNPVVYEIGYWRSFYLDCLVRELMKVHCPNMSELISELECNKEIAEIKNKSFEPKYLRKEGKMKAEIKDIYFICHKDKITGKAIKFECIACRCINSKSVEPGYINGEMTCEYCGTANIIDLRREGK